MAKRKVSVSKEYDDDPEDRAIGGGDEYEEEQNPPDQRGRTDANTAKAKSVDATHGTSLTPVHEVVNPQGFQEDMAELEETTGVAGTNMTATEAAAHVEAGTEDTLAEHEPPIDNPGGAVTGLEAANAGEVEDPFKG
jgi:hypothetical protein